MACGRRGEKRDDGEGKGGRIEGSWMRREVRRGEDRGGEGRRTEGRIWENGGKMQDDGGSYRLQLIRGFAVTVFMR